MKYIEKWTLKEKIVLSLLFLAGLVLVLVGAVINKTVINIVGAAMLILFFFYLYHLNQKSEKEYWVELNCHLNPFSLYDMLNDGRSTKDIDEIFIGRKEKKSLYVTGFCDTDSFIFELRGKSESICYSFQPDNQEDIIRAFNIMLDQLAKNG